MAYHAVGISWERGVGGGDDKQWATEITKVDNICRGGYELRVRGAKRGSAVGPVATFTTFIYDIHPPFLPIRGVYMNGWMDGWDGWIDEYSPCP